MEEKALVKRAVRGDKDAFAALYEKLYQDMYRMALYTLQNPHDAEDVVSETVLDAYSEVRSLRKETSFRTWIFRILISKCKRRMREYYYRTEELPEELPTAAEASLDERVAVRSVFAKLEEEERLIVGMHVICGYKTREIADILNRNENTIRSRESRALRKLEKELEDIG